MRRRAIRALALAMLLAASLLMPACSRPEETVVETPEPVWSEGYTWGSFDELRMVRYYLIEEVPDMDGVPTDDIESVKGTYEFLYVEGPVDTDFGPCWAAVYRDPSN